MSNRNLAIVVVGAHVSVLVLAVVFGGCVKGKKVPKLTSAAPVQELRAPEAKPESILEPKGMVEETDLLVSREPEAIPPKVEPASPPAPQPTAILEGERHAEAAEGKEKVIGGLAAEKEKALSAAAEKKEKKMEAAAEEREKKLSAIGERKEMRPIVPAVKRREAVPPAAAGTRKGAGGTHKVAPGESLWKISQQYGVSVAELAAANGLKKDSAVRIGQVLMIPGPAGMPVAERKEKTAMEKAPAAAKGKPVTGKTQGAAREKAAAEKTPVAAGESEVEEETPEEDAPAAAKEAKAPAPATVEKPKVPGAAKTHVVKKGETLSSIAKRYGVSLKKIIEVNKIADPGKVKAGRSLVIP